MGIDLTEKKNRTIVSVVLLATVLLCTLPMGLSPIWNGEEPEHRNQYEIMAESILEGHLYLNYDDIDPLLLTMDNPYNPQARVDLGVEYHWDHAFYNGHYYMYFGVVPVFLLFLPFRMITGTSLTTYHATQVFVAFFICGVFAVFRMMAKKFFPKMSMCTYLSLSVAFSAMSVWYSVACPALYCTAITSALCMMIWSLYFFARAVWVETEQKKTIFYAFFGSLFGALAFGCRPPVALGNLFVIPLLVQYLKKRKIDFKLIRRLAVAASPYLVVAALLMLYNYARFENPFEFGQAYQLTTADQSNYGSFFERFNWYITANGLIYNFFAANSLNWGFPYVTFNGIYLTFPILGFSVIGLAPESVRRSIKEKQQGFFVAMLFAIPIVITVLDIVWSPFLTERYRMDMYWIMGVLCFFVIGFYYMHMSDKDQLKFSSFISLFGFVTLCTGILLFMVQNDGNFTSYYPEAIEEIKLVLKLGRGA